MQILKQGNAKTSVLKGQCEVCKCVLECSMAEAQLHYSPTLGPVFNIACPECPNKYIALKVYALPSQS